MAEDTIPGGHVEDGVFVPDGLTIYDVTAPSDRAHREIKGETMTNEGDRDATKVARAAAFELPNVQGGQTDEDRKASQDRAEALEKVKSDDDSDSAEYEDPSPEPADGLTGPDGDGHPQTDEEAQEAEAERREGMSASELEEAEARDAMVAEEDPDDEIPNVGSQDPEKTADSDDTEESE